MELLENAVDALKAGREPSLEDLTSQQTEVELRMPSLLPDDFIPDVNTRLSFYKRIASAKPAPRSSSEAMASRRFCASVVIAFGCGVNSQA
ncbi:TRCF domain-containing protein [Enterobacter roggenkampii]|uniref:TRCF domain-containing protein n=1 Tax=Enterobacter roggenkampii TaxID=1812935 RepID=UPI003C12FFEA